MANELSGTVSWTYNKNGAILPFDAGSQSITVTGNKLSRDIIGITTAAPQEISLGDVAGNGFLLVKNIAAISINIGVTTPFQTSLKPGEPFCGRMIGTKLYAQATGTSAMGNLDVFVIDD